MKTIIDLFESSVGNYGDNVYLWEKTKDKYIGSTYKEVKKDVMHFAGGLLSLGIEKGDRCALLSEGRNAWIISELGILYSGGVNVPLSVKLTESEIVFRVNHSQCKFLIVSSNYLNSVRSVKNQISGIEKYIVISPDTDLEDDELSYLDILSGGEEYLGEDYNRIEDVLSGIKADDYANISYTSGTTADPKGIILSHNNYVSNVIQAASLMFIPSHYKTLLILPWDHSFAHTAGLYSFMYYGASIASVQCGKNPMEAIRNIPLNIKEIKPDLLMSVPALAKNFKKNIESAIRKKGPRVEKLFHKALNIAYKYNGNGWNKGRGLRLFYKPLIRIFDKILFSKIRDNFGGNLKYFIGGGALLDIEIQKFFYAIGVPMFQGYGLSEASPIISSNATKKHKLGSSGFIVKPMELKICNEEGKELPKGEKGEIVIKGGNVMMGYWRNTKSTLETIKNGWLHTGDMGYVDKDGFLYVLGRFKSLLISNDGEKYSPEGIEEALVDQSPYFEQCVLYNNQDPYTVALVVPNKLAVNSYLKNNNIDPFSEQGRHEGLQLLNNEINQYRSGGKYENMFPERWLPAATAVLPEEFSEDNKLVNSTMKVVRGKVIEYFRDDLEHLYTPQGKDFFNEKNKSNISRFIVG